MGKSRKNVQQTYEMYTEVKECEFQSNDSHKEIISRINNIFPKRYERLKDFSIQCDMTESKLCKILSGKQKNLNMDDFKKIANALNISYEYLLDGFEQSKTQNLSFPDANSKQNHFLRALVKLVLALLKEYELK